ncbi:MAG TPA: hypothetical protein VFA78_03795, partial [Chloroflexota bacterium]|nr:hypothetical protein [Chloroflexota bacterium]
DPSEHNVIAVWAVARPPDYQSAPPGIAWAASADGSTIAEVVPVWTDFPPPSDPDTVQARDPYTAQTTQILVRDGRTGAIRRAITPHGWVAWPQLSADGTRLLVADGSHQTALVYNAKTGDLVSTLNIGPQVSPVPEGSSPTQIGPQAWLAPDMSRRYTLGPPSAYPAGTTPPAQLVAYDLTSGAVVGQLSLPEARSGAFQTTVTMNGRSVAVPVVLDPGLAISPDGRQLAVVATDTGTVTVTLVDAAHLTIERTFTAKPPTGLVRRALAWLGVTPHDAAAKGSGPIAAPAAIYAPDGKSLYVFGSEMNTASPYPDRDLGIQRISLVSGTIAATLPSTQRIVGITQIIPSPDGGSLYVISQGSTAMLRRLDARTLTVQATRSFDTLPWIVVRSGG